MRAVALHAAAALGVSPAGLCQLHMARAALDQAPPAWWPPLLGQYPELRALLAAAAERWAADNADPAAATVSSVQAAVAAAVAGLGLGAVEEEHAAAGSCRLLVDVAVPGRRLAVEVDGPLHFARNAPAVQVGATLDPNTLTRTRVLTLSQPEPLTAGAL
jgi:hypothetical protein